MKVKFKFDLMRRFVNKGCPLYSIMSMFITEADWNNFVQARNYSKEQSSRVQVRWEDTTPPAIGKNRIQKPQEHGSAPAHNKITKCCSSTFTYKQVTNNILYPCSVKFPLDIQRAGVLRQPKPWETRIMMGIRNKLVFRFLLVCCQEVENGHTGHRG